MILDSRSCCSSRSPPAPARGRALDGHPGPPVDRSRWSPSRSGVHGPDGVHLESFDADRAVRARRRGPRPERHDGASPLPATCGVHRSPPMSGSVHVQLGLAHREERLGGGRRHFKEMTRSIAATHRTPKMRSSSWGPATPRWGTGRPRPVFARLLERQDLNADDQIEAMGARALPSSNWTTWTRPRGRSRRRLPSSAASRREERLDRLLPGGGQIPPGPDPPSAVQGPGAAAACGSDVRDLDARPACCCRRRTSTSRPSSSATPGWASASGFQVGSFYEEFYDAFMNAPEPS